MNIPGGTTGEAGYDSGSYRDEIYQLCSEYRDLKSVDSERLGRYADYRLELEAARESQRMLDTSDYGRRKLGEAALSRHQINLPFGMAMTVKHAYRISGRLPDAFVDPRDETIKEKWRSDVMEKIWWGIVRESQGDQQISAGAWDASQLGAAAFDLRFNVLKQMPLFRSIDPAGVLVVRGLEDAHDFQRTYRFWQVPLRTAKAEYRNQSFRGYNFVEQLESTHKTGNEEMVTLVEMCDRTRCIRFSEGGYVPLLEYDHNYGFVPTVIIPNLGPERQIWGWADYEFTRSVTRYLPEIFSRQADVIRAAAGGGYLDKKTGQSVDEIKRIIQQGGVLPVGREGNVEPISGPETPDFTQEHLETAVEFLKMLGFSPDASWGGGDAGSGSDRGLQLQPLLEYTAMKQINWSSGLSRLAAYAYRMSETKQVSAAYYRGSTQAGSRRSPFNLIIGPEVEPLTVDNPDGLDDLELQVSLPRTPVELYDGDYLIRFVFQNRIDPDDPSYVMSELNKFQQSAQSLQTTLERFGVQNPEDEMVRMEKEAERFPWLRQAQIALAKVQAMQASQTATQGEGGGAPVDPSAGLFDALDTMNTPDGSALDADAGAGALPGENPGTLYGAA